jgi:DNA-binding NarL/FixJ family response regulator
MTSDSPKRILVLRNQLLMNAGLQSLLSKQESLEVIGKEIQNQDDLFRFLERLKPDVIIVDEGILAPKLADLLKFLQSYPKKRTIIMSLEKNQIQVYDTKQIQLHQLGDFLALL